MQTFKEFYSDGGGAPDEAPRGQAPELDNRMAKMKSQQLINLRKQIAQHKAAAQSGQATLSPEDVERLKHMVSKAAGELEGTRLPPEAEGAARDAYRDLVAMGESAEDESYSHALWETANLLKGFVPADSLFTEKGEGFTPRKYLNWDIHNSPRAGNTGDAYSRAYDNEMKRDINKSVRSPQGSDEQTFGVGRARNADLYAQRHNTRIPGTPEHQGNKEMNDRVQARRAKRIAAADKKKERGEHVHWMEDPRKA